MAIIWAALSTRETLSLEPANKDRDSVEKWPIYAKKKKKKKQVTPRRKFT